MRLLLFNLVMDADDSILAFTTDWTAALARRCEQVDVVTMSTGRVVAPPNVRVFSVGKEKGYSEPRRALEFYRILHRLLNEGPGYDACFAHMQPLFALMGAPLLKWKRVPIVTWYAHPTLTPLVKAAHRASDVMITSLPTAYPYRDDKLVVVGQGIDTSVFSPAAPREMDEPPLLLFAGRLSPVKRLETLLEAAAIVRERHAAPFQVALVGGAFTGLDRGYLARLQALARERGIEDMVHFPGAAKPGPALREWYGRCWAHVNMTMTGSGDKVVLEAMACGRISIVANEGFRQTLGEHADQLTFRYGDAEHLAERLRWVLRLAPEERDALGARLRERVVAMHDVHRLAGRLVQLFTQVRANPGSIAFGRTAGGAEAASA